MAQWMELFNYTILEHRYIEIRQQTGCPCGSQFLYEISGNRQSCSLDHALGLRKRAESAESSKPDNKRITDCEIRKGLMNPKYSIGDLQSGKESEDNRTKAGYIKKSDQNRKENDISAHFYDSFEAVHHTLIKYREIQTV